MWAFDLQMANQIMYYEAPILKLFLILITCMLHSLFKSERPILGVSLIEETQKGNSNVTRIPQ